ncbi:MAG: hypothetical protein AB7H43_15440 [Acidimicrobiia bacterium]
MSRCRSCKAPIVWAVSTTDRRIPIDTLASERGNVVYVDPAASPPVVQVLGQAELAARPTRAGLYTAHFATCPNAREHRR